MEQSVKNAQIISSRVLKASVHVVWKAFADPQLLQRWWGPKGFTNTFHEFDLRPGGRWVLTMHGPEKGNYENSAVFTVVEPGKLVAWRRISQPHFNMEVALEEVTGQTTRITFRMMFRTEEECNKIRRFAEPNNQENFDRLEQVILH